MYNPVNGRWLSRDPLALSDTPEIAYSHNYTSNKMQAILAPYVYVENNPILHTDPSGLATDDCGDEPTKPTKPTPFPLPKNKGTCYGFCVSGPKSTGAEIKIEWNLTSFTQDPNNSSFVCPVAKTLKEGVEMLSKRFNDAQSPDKKNPVGKKAGWGFNLCGSCKCDWESGTNMELGKRYQVTFNKTIVGQVQGIFQCKYTISWMIIITVVNGILVISPCV